MSALFGAVVLLLAALQAITLARAVGRALERAGRSLQVIPRALLSHWRAWRFAVERRRVKRAESIGALSAETAADLAKLALDLQGQLAAMQAQVLQLSSLKAAEMNASLSAGKAYEDAAIKAIMAGVQS